MLYPLIILMTTDIIIIIYILNELFGIFYTNLARHQLRGESIAERGEDTGLCQSSSNLAP